LKVELSTAKKELEKRTSTLETPIESEMSLPSARLKDLQVSHMTST
jgi:hypothetical protein